MITFLKKRSYDLVYMFITQLAISLFGLALAFAVPVNQSALRIGTSVFSVLFYLFLIWYIMFLYKKFTIGSDIINE